MATGRLSGDFYTQVLDCAGFYRDGRPLADCVWSADALQEAAHSNKTGSFERIDRAFKYHALLRPEGDKGKIGVSDIFELSQSPCIYFKRWDAEPTAAELTRQLLDWQRTVWNDGRAPMLWVVTQTEVRILNAYVRPQRRQGAAALKRVEIGRFKNIAEGLDQLRQFVSREQIESGRFWKSDEARSIKRQNRVDKQLIRDLGSAAKQLQAKDLDLAEAHRLLLRSIFAKYLEVRGWLSGRFLQKTFGIKQFNDALADASTTQRVFDWLAETFNGDVFPHHPEAKKYSKGQLGELQLLLDGGDPKTGQRYLWPYEFGTIPVELLSSIYESFSHALDQHAAEARSVHYTPINLVELTLNEAFDDELFGTTLPSDAKVADLACGSGVFLVQSLRRLVARRVAAGETLTRDLIRNTLYDQIFGVDVLGGAVHIAAISLYLAALELDPNPGSGNKIKFQPLIYPTDEEKRRKRRHFNLFEADAFDTKADFNRQGPFTNKQLSVVVGNPPWTRPAGVRSERLGGEAAETPLHIHYCQENSIRLPNQDPPDQAFFWRAADFAADDARFGMILSGRRFFSHDEDSVAAKRDFLLRFAPLMMMNLGELHREGIFPTAVHPAMIVVARNRRAQRGVDCTYATVERSRTFRGHGVLEIRPDLIKPLSVFRAAQDEDFLKIASWGSARDAALIRHLKQFSTLEEFLEQRNVRPHVGFIRGAETHPIPRENINQPCLETEGWTPFRMSTAGLPLLRDGKMERPRPEGIYRGPLLLFTLSLSESGLTASICQAERLVYSQRYCGIPLPKTETPEWADYLNGIFNSPVSAYFTFLTGSVWGVERDDAPLTDFSRLPIPPIDESPDSAANVIRMAREMRLAAVDGRVPSPAKKRRLDGAVFALYHLEPNQAVLVEDMLANTIDLQRSREQSPALRRPSPDVLSDYCGHFLGVIDQFLALRNERRATADVFALPSDCPLQVVKFSVLSRSSHPPAVRVVARQELGHLLERIAKGLPAEIAADVYTHRRMPALRSRRSLSDQAVASPFLDAIGRHERRRRGAFGTSEELLVNVGTGQRPPAPPDFLRPEDTILPIIAAVLRIAAEAWNRVLRDGVLNATHRRDEPAIAGLLRHRMVIVEREREPREPELKIKPEVGVTAEDEEIVVGSIDIEVVYSLGDEPDLRVECKRVSGSEQDDAKGLAREYVKEGVLRFVGKYGRGHAWGIMVGFVVDGNVAAAVALLAQYITSYQNEPPHVLRAWGREARLGSHDNLFSTCHRKQGGSPIELLHLFLPFPTTRGTA